MCQHSQHGHSRRDFFSQLLSTSFAGAGVLEVAGLRAAWAQSQSGTAPANLFDIEKIADGVYFAFAHPAALANSNAAIFVNSKDVLVVDAHSKPSAAAALIAQIRKEVTTKPVRWLVNSHFHFDHAQGNKAYADAAKAAGTKFDIVASGTTKQLMATQLVPRLKMALDPASPGPKGSEQVARRLDSLREQLGKATAEADKTRVQGQIAQVQAFAEEMKNFEPSLPTITFDKSHIIKDADRELHLEFHGRAHTAGDIVVYCPKTKVVASGDAIHPGFPAFVDAYPLLWPGTIDSVSRLGFEHILGGHGRAQHDRRDMTGERNYIAELAGRVADGRKAGQTVAELQQTITVESLKSLHADGYMANVAVIAMRLGLAGNIADAYDRIGAA